VTRACGGCIIVLAFVGRSCLGAVIRSIHWVGCAVVRRGLSHALFTVAFLCDFKQWGGPLLGEQCIWPSNCICVCNGDMFLCRQCVSCRLATALLGAMYSHPLVLLVWAAAS
jgi:hypothetical protein